MASRMRSARRRLKKELLRCVKAEQGDKQTLRKVAKEIMGHEVGVEDVMDFYYANAVSNAMDQLRKDGETETVDGEWLATANLTGDHVESVSVRRLKRVRGELKAQARLAHDHGRIEEAIMVDRMLGIINEKLREHAEADASTTVPA